MGTTQSQTIVNQLSEQISNVAASTVQSCEIAVDQSQSLDVVNTGFEFGSKYKAEQRTDVSSQCFSDTKKEADLQNKILQTIAQTSTADGSSALDAFGSSQSIATTNLHNLIKSNVTMSNIQKSYTSIKLEQKAKFVNQGTSLFRSVELTQGSKIFAAATLREVTNAGIMNTIEAHIKQKSTASTSNPLLMVAIVVFAIVVACIAAYVYYRSRASAPVISGYNDTMF